MPVYYAFRPEQVEIGDAEQGIPAEVDVIEPTGADTLVFSHFCGTQVCAVFGERMSLKPRETIHLQPNVEHVHLFDSATGKVLMNGIGK
jgi:multiple sugar transport system ATP-binding protein